MVWLTRVRRVSQAGWHYLQSRRGASRLVSHSVVLALLALVLLSGIVGVNVFGAFASTHCASGDQAYFVVSGDTLGGIAARYHTSWQRLAAYNHLANPNQLAVHQQLCIQGQQTGGGGGGGEPPGRGQGNPFPPGQCTWWASQRYHELHGIYVPWTTQSNAWQWVARASDFHWHVSSQPSRGAIIVLQPWVQGAYGLGHVAVVEQVLGNGHVIASNMNWGSSPGRVTNVEFAPGRGVGFVSY